MLIDNSGNDAESASENDNENEDFIGGEGTIAFNRFLVLTF